MKGNTKKAKPVAMDCIWVCNWAKLRLTADWSKEDLW